MGNCHQWLNNSRINRQNLYQLWEEGNIVFNKCIIDAIEINRFTDKSWQFKWQITKFLYGKYSHTQDQCKPINICIQFPHGKVKNETLPNILSQYYLLTISYLCRAEKSRCDEEISMQGNYCISFKTLSPNGELTRKVDEWFGMDFWRTKTVIWIYFKEEL